MNNYCCFDEKQIEYLRRTQDSWLNVAEGGKRGGKNVLNALSFCIALENHPNRFFLLAGVDQSSARINIAECDGFGIKNYFVKRCRAGKFEKKDCLYVKTRTGEKVLFFAGGKRDGDEANIKGYTYGMAYITEANECHKKFLNEVMDRTLSSDDRKIFHDLNPKPPSHWYYSEFLDFHEKQQNIKPKYGYNYGHFNIFNNLSISDDKLRTTLSTYNKNSIWYKRDILGNRIANSGVLFGEIANNKDRYLIDNLTIGGFITTGVDFGKNGSPHAFCSQKISRDFNNIQVLRSDEVDCTENGIKVTDDLGVGETLARLKVGFIKHIKYVLNKWGGIEAIYCDSAEPELIEFLKKCLQAEGLHIGIYGSIKIEISSRIHLWGVMLMQDRIKFLKNETDEIVKALQDATQDDKAEDDRYLDDKTSDIDILDAHNYGIEKWYKQFLRLGGGN